MHPSRAADIEGEPKAAPQLWPRARKRPIRKSSSPAGESSARLRARGRERRVELVAGWPSSRRRGDGAVLHSPRHLDPSTLAILVAAYVARLRAKFDIADGYTVPTELVLVPMLFLLPTPLVPLVVSSQLGRWAG